LAVYVPVVVIAPGSIETVTVALFVPVTGETSSVIGLLVSIDIDHVNVIV
jgi:hypothetical protein